MLRKMSFLSVLILGWLKLYAFDWKFYIKNCPELTLAADSSYQKAVEHFFSDGIHKGTKTVPDQIINTNFDWQFYLKQNNLSGIMTDSQAYDHYLNVGYFKKLPYCNRFKISILFHIEHLDLFDEYAHRINAFMRYNNFNDYEVRISLPVAESLEKFDTINPAIHDEFQSAKIIDRNLSGKSQNKIKAIAQYIVRSLKVPAEKITIVLVPDISCNAEGFLRLVESLQQDSFKPDFLIRIHTDANERMRNLTLSFLNICINPLLNANQYIYSNKLYADLPIEAISCEKALREYFKIYQTRFNYEGNYNSMFIICSKVLDLFKEGSINELISKVTFQRCSTACKIINDFLNQAIYSLNLKTHVLEYYPRRYIRDNLPSFDSKPISYDKTKISAIVKEYNIVPMAYYFPQFHECNENNRFWGKGFTEWTLLNAYAGEIKKPHTDIGYYNMLDYNTRKKQALIAKAHGIGAFNYYHYWFKDRPVMNEGVEKILQDGEPNIPFVFTWDNSSWIRSWTGYETMQVLIKQEYGNQKDWQKHYEFLIKFFKHPNYIKEDNCPLFFIWKLNEIEQAGALDMLSYWNDRIKKDGFSGIKYIVTNFIDGQFFKDFNKILKLIHGFAEMQPGMFLFLPKLYGKMPHIYQKGVINYFDKLVLFNAAIKKEKPYFNHYWSVMYGFENSARRIGETPKTKFVNLSYQLFERELIEFIYKIAKYPNKGSNFLLINSWNEWTEQAMIEPNDHDGYEILNVIKRVFCD